MDKSIKVVITLENKWEEQDMWLVEELVKTFFSLKHRDNFQWFSVEPGSVVVTFLAPKHLKQRLIENSEKSTQFMKLIGIVSLQVEEHFVFKGEESIMFSFENSLIQATVDNNIEVFKYRLYTEEKVSMGFIIPSDEVARLINPIETVPRCLAGFYYVKIAKQQLRSYSTV